MYACVSAVREGGLCTWCCEVSEMVVFVSVHIATAILVVEVVSVSVPVSGSPFDRIVVLLSLSAPSLLSMCGPSMLLLLDSSSRREAGRQREGIGVRERGGKVRGGRDTGCLF